MIGMMVFLLLVVAVIGLLISIDEEDNTRYYQLDNDQRVTYWNLPPGKRSKYLKGNTPGYASMREKGN